MFVFAKACPYLPALITIVQNSWQMQPNLPKQGCARPIICFIEKNTLTWDDIAMQNKMVWNVFPNHQIRNN